MKLQNKKSSMNIVPEAVIFIILQILFFVGIAIFLSYFGTGSASIEKREARRLALSIDELRPGTEAVISLADIYFAADKNLYKDKVVSVDPENGIITVKVIKGDGSSFKFFSKLPANSITLDANKKTLTVRA
jgi:hypothetical protein